MNRTFAERLKEARLARGISQAELARKAGVVKATISNLERGASLEMSMTNLFAVSKVLQVNAEWLATGHGTKHPDLGTLPVSEEVQKLALLIDRLTNGDKDMVISQVQRLLK